MFEMQMLTQTDNHNLRKIFATNKKYVQRKMCLKFPNPKFGNLYKSLYFVIKWEPFGVWCHCDHSGTSKSGWIKLYASVSY